ncbi:peptide chain release factor N(5)-glutamine methyltransferase [Anaerovorax odorimutans]|uniref:peptide chain release factor N(5)-glutamine methyltransferase n=1 Tax=Anaerovorax odorimutans TaxID=109327 RepID=UPI0003FBEA91|nr:peptide chain release factor N(5)-glutamine methyltransferase [Anaerovorax odorimutans]
MSLLVKEILQIAERRLQDSHCMDPKLDAEMLFCYMLSIDKTQLFLRRSKLLDERSCEEYFNLIDLRAGGKPVQYITGQQEFMGITFKVNENVLIPRQDTETLVEEVIKDIKESDKIKKHNDILDLCCGSGAIGISLSRFFANSKIVATDISEEALNVARENGKNMRVSKKVKFIQSDLFDNIKSGVFGQKFNIIISNPPYIATHLIPILQREIKEHEPIIALDGGDDGLKFYKRIIEHAPDYLKKEGKLYLEIGHDQGANILQLISDGGKLKDACIIKDLSGLDRVIKCHI